MNIIKNKTFRITFLFIILAELISLIGFLMPEINTLAFFVIVFLFFIITLDNLKNGLLIILVELFIGSKGHLFFIDFDGLLLSIRIAMWLIIIAVWLAKYLTTSLKDKKLDNEYFHLKFLKQKIGPYYVLLFIFIFWGLVNAFLNNNKFNDIFFDINGWLYFVLFFPVMAVFNSREESKGLLMQLGAIFSASIIWISVKTLFLLYIFSHNIIGMIFEVYRWVRVSGVGEITQMQGGFYRVFFQSHIFVLIGFFIVLLYLVHIIKDKELKIKKFYPYFILLSVLLSVTLISFSRSNWLGLVVGLVISSLYVIYNFGWKIMLKKAVFLILAGIFSIILILGIVKFPFPDPLGGFNTADLLSKRATQFQGEAALSSRWALFPVIWSEIKASPIPGSGFGSTATYKSSDPRVLSQSLSGEYTTTAFEWGWLDIWLKIGFFGLVAYIALLFKIFITGITNSKENADIPLLHPALAIGIVVIAAVSFFSPYLNHPLGIGYILVVSAIIFNGPVILRKPKKSANEIS